MRNATLMAQLNATQREAIVKRLYAHGIPTPQSAGLDHLSRCVANVTGVPLPKSITDRNFMLIAFAEGTGTGAALGAVKPKHEFRELRSYVTDRGMLAALERVRAFRDAAPSWKPGTAA